MLHYFNVVPVRNDNVDFAISEIKRQAALGVKEVAICLSFHAQTTPARKLIPILCSRLRRVIEGCAGSDVKIGVLIQSTQGHGWNGRIPLTDEKWQHSIYLDGKENPRHCMLDPGFRAYVLEAITEVCKEGPEFLLIDDDFGPRSGEGFCPLHIAAYNHELGKDLTQADYIALAKSGDWENPDRIKIENIRRRVPIEFAGEIRKAIDSVNPSIRCGMCTPGNGHGFTRDVAMALAGNTRPFVRVCNATYGRATPECFHGIVTIVRQLINLFEGIDDIVAEADTWPQNYWSESGTMFSCHLLTDILLGLDGAKLWMSEFDYSHFEDSQCRFEARFSRELPKREALYALLKDGAEYHGVIGNLPKVHWLGDSVRMGGDGYADLCNMVCGPFGFPVYYKKPGSKDPRDIYTLSENDVDLLQDADLLAILSSRVFVDASGAKALSKRGFSNLMGVEATDGDASFAFTVENPLDGSDQMNIMWDASAASLRPLAEDVKVISEFAFNSPGGVSEEKGPALTVFENRLGGKVAVAGWSIKSPWYKFLKPSRRELLLKVFDMLAGGFFPGMLTSPSFGLCFNADLPGGDELIAAANLSLDPWHGLSVRMREIPANAEMLCDDGKWIRVAVSQTGEDEVTFDCGEIATCEYAIVRIPRSEAETRAKSVAQSATTAFGTAEARSVQPVTLKPEDLGPGGLEGDPEWRAHFHAIPSSLDGSQVGFYAFVPEEVQGKVPLLVGLHTWSYTGNQATPAKELLAMARERGWAFLYPHFRGPNNNPEACGSELAIRDIIDSTEWMRDNHAVDPPRIYLTGASGGGHMTLLVAGRQAESGSKLFAAFASFCPLTDVARWHADSLIRDNGYAAMMEKCCGGTPAENRVEYVLRSPLTYLSRKVDAPVYIATGIHDGHTGSIPVGHSIRAFNAIVDASSRINEFDISEIETDEKVPERLAFKGSDPFYPESMRIHLRKTSGNARLTIFEGGHSSNFPAALDFFSRQELGAAVDFTLPETVRATCRAASVSK